ncbi:hypothetical protein VIGAN_09045400 [Vigna angularis var. angularis]|uniref:Uncharacterized protein n=1 Tax=Vigna angularis var. angularis TaxID=157739 RepID=A0A0S3SW12_PHAAN|nr:hypothetical protein VIGAN_09045400 [Vigna angularis var. angularis]
MEEWMSTVSKWCSMVKQKREKKELPLHSKAGMKEHFTFWLRKEAHGLHVQPLSRNLNLQQRQPAHPHRSSMSGSMRRRGKAAWAVLVCRTCGSVLRAPPYLFLAQ